MLQAPFSWRPPDVHVVPTPFDLQGLGLVSMDDKAASGEHALPLGCLKLCPLLQTPCCLVCQHGALQVQMPCPVGVSTMRMKCKVPALCAYQVQVPCQ